ncbi:MAG: TRAP transporter large permease subunit, partial [Lentisphaeria bacterium]|nr:TRAP transporter large permease subunit [Lentisphaeria bacterium]
PAHAGTTLREKLAATPQVLDILVLFLVIMYTLMTGKVTPTEVAGVACLLAVGMCLLRRKLSWAKFRNSLRDTLRITCMVFIIMAGAKVFGMFLTLSYLPTRIAQEVGDLGLPGPAILAIILFCYIVGGCLMDALAFLLISLPIFLPLIKELGYDPIWFGVVVCVVTTLGAITPPIGISCYVIAGMCKSVRVEQVFRGAMYYVPSYILTVAVLLLFPHFTVGWLASFAR